MSTPFAPTTLPLASTVYQCTFAIKIHGDQCLEGTVKRLLAKALQASPWHGSDLSFSWRRQEGDQVAELELSERQLHAFRSWLRNICEAVKSDPQPGWLTHVHSVKAAMTLELLLEPIEVGR